MLIQEKISAQIFFRNGASITLTEKNIISASVRRQCCPDSSFEIGGVYSASLSMTANIAGTNSYNIRGAKIILKHQYGNEETFQPAGTFWITKASRVSGDLYSVTAQDAVGWLDTSSTNYSAEVSDILENCTKYLSFYSAAVIDQTDESAGWFGNIVGFVNDLLERIIGERVLNWENYDINANGRYTNEWNFNMLSDGRRAMEFTCSVNNGSGQSSSPRDLFHYLAELAGGFVYAKENGNLTLGQFGQAEFGQAEINLSEIEQDSCEIAEYLYQRVYTGVKAYGNSDFSTTTPIDDYSELVPLRLLIESNPFLDGFFEISQTGTSEHPRDSIHAVTDGLFYFHHRKDISGNLTDDYCFFRPFRCKVHKQDRFHLGQRIRFVLGETPAEQPLSTITSVRWTFRGGWELACAGEDSRTMADALQRSKADKALIDAKLRYENLLSKISGGGV